jgi:hypothetical protein
VCRGRNTHGVTAKGGIKGTRIMEDVMISFSPLPLPWFIAVGLRWTARLYCLTTVEQAGCVEILRGGLRAQIRQGEKLSGILFRLEFSEV